MTVLCCKFTSISFPVTPDPSLCSAQKHGLLCEVDSDDEDKELCEPFFAHCKAHSIKEIAKRKVKNLYSFKEKVLNYYSDVIVFDLPQRRDYLTVMTKQKMFNFDGNDERVWLRIILHMGLSA